MRSQIESSEALLRSFLASIGKDGGLPSIDRKEVVAHATLSALQNHWPSRSSRQIEELLANTVRVKNTEQSRWATQRRIAIAKLVRYFKTDSVHFVVNSPKNP